MSAPVKPPKVLKNVFGAEARGALLRELCAGPLERATFDEGCGRWALRETECPLLKERLDELVPLARATFESDTLLPTYAFFARYEGERARLARHKDTNGCTYTIDYCLEQREPWDIWVVDQPYALNENEALAMYGTAQDHWRNGLSRPDVNRVSMIFFHFVEPTHWWCTRGPHYRLHVSHLYRVAKTLPDPEHRAFLVLLSRAETSAGFYQSVARRFRTGDPAEKVAGWVDALCTPSGPPGLSLNNTMRRIVCALVRGAPRGQIAATLNRTRRTPVTADDIERAEAEVRSSPLSLLLP